MVSPLLRSDMAQQYFTGPTTSEGPAGGGRLFIRFRLTRGITIYRQAGKWYQIRYPTEDQTAAADPGTVLKGGYSTPISDSLATELTNAGYGQYITTGLPPVQSYDTY